MRQIVRNQIPRRDPPAARRAKRVGCATILPDRAVRRWRSAIGKQSLERYESALMLLPRGSARGVVMRLEMGFSSGDRRGAGHSIREAASVSIRRALQRLKKKMPDPELSR